MEGVHVLVDVSCSSGWAVSAARALLARKLSKASPRPVAVTLLGTPCTENDLAPIMEGYEHITTVHGLVPVADAAVLARLDLAADSDDTRYADIVSAVVLAIYSFQCRTSQAASSLQVVLLCDASGLDEEAGEDDADQIIQIVQQCTAHAVRLSVISPLPLPEARTALRLLCEALGPRCDFQVCPTAKAGSSSVKGGGQDDGQDDASHELRIDGTDGHAYTWKEFVAFYGGTAEWDEAKPAPEGSHESDNDDRISLALRALRAHALWSGWEQERQALRALTKSLADKRAREGMARAVGASSGAVSLAPAPACSAQDAGKHEEDGTIDAMSPEDDAFAEWDLRPSHACEPGTSDLSAQSGAMQHGDAFSVTGALTPADVTDARIAGAAIVRACDGASVADGVAEGAADAVADDVAERVAEGAAEGTGGSSGGSSRCDFFGEGDEFQLATAETDVPASRRQLRPHEADALSNRARAHKQRLVVAAGSGEVCNESSMLSRLLDVELPFARVLVSLEPESAAVLATAVCRDIRQRAAPLYSRLCRVVVRRLESAAREINHRNSAQLVPSDALPREHLPPDAPDGDGGRWERAPADGIARGVWAEVRALVDEAACHAFCLGDKDGASADDDAAWRMRTVIKTLRASRTLGDYAVQTLAPAPNKLKVDRPSFEALSAEDQAMLLARGLVQKTVVTVEGCSAPVRFLHKTRPAGRPIAPDLDVALQLAKCQLEERAAFAALEHLKREIRHAWPGGTKVEVPGEGSVALGRAAGASQRVLYGCSGGEAAFQRELNAAEQSRLQDVFARPDVLVHVRGHAVGREHGKRGMTVNSSGRALAASCSIATDTQIPHLPTHSFGARRVR